MEHFLLYVTCLLVPYRTPKNVQDSGILNYVEYGNDIIVDRGFFILGDLAFDGAPLNIPPFSMDKQLSVCIAVAKDT